MCGSPERSENTSIIGSKKSIGSTIEYVCPDGYMLMGSKYRVCEATGFWSENPPACKCKIYTINIFSKKKKKQEEKRILSD